MTIALAMIDRVGQVQGVLHTLMQDPDGVYDDLVERYHTRSLSSMFCKNAAELVNRGNDTLIHNYEPTPAPKINQLVVPTGSTRWSYCLLLADDTLKNAIYTASNKGKTAMQLIFGTPINGANEALNAVAMTVWILPPRRLSPETLDGDVNNLWIIPVVDGRYWWQFKHTDDLSGKITTDVINTPDKLVDAMLTMTRDPTLNVLVNPNHAILPSCATTNDYENLPIVMDSIFAHYGQRLVVDIGSWTGGGYAEPTVVAPGLGVTRYAVIDGENSQYILDNNKIGHLGLKTASWTGFGVIAYAAASASAGTARVGTPYLVAGGAGSAYPSVGPYASVPEGVDIQTTEGVYTYKARSVVAAYTVLDGGPGGPAIWRTKFPTEPSAIAITQLAKDYYDQYRNQYDFTFAGVQPWQQGYFDDYMVFRQTWNPKTNGYDAYTRVCSRQPNMTGEWTSQSGGSVETAWGKLNDKSGRDDKLMQVELYDSAKPLDFLPASCGGSGSGSEAQGIFKDMDFTLCTSLGSTLALVPAGYKAGVVGLIRWRDCNPGSGSTGGMGSSEGSGSGQAWDGWVVVFGRRLRCDIEIPKKWECCPIEGLKATAYKNFWIFGEDEPDRLDPCAPSGSGTG